MLTPMQKRVEQRKAPESLLKVLLLHLSCGLGLASAFWVTSNFYSLTLIQNAPQTLFILWAVKASVIIPAFSLFRKNPDKCSYVKAIARGLMGLPAGALVNTLGAIVLGAPVGIQHFKKTINWSLLMSVFTFVPAASVFGSSWTDWQRIFAFAKPTESTDFIICVPAHGAVIGAWFGAWPMPLDWERAWQEWPICVTYGAVLGYSIGLVLSFGLIVFRRQQHHGKED